MKGRLFFTVLVVMLAGLVSCSDNAIEPESGNYSDVYRVADLGATSVYRVVDEQYGVVCWLYSRGISCLPIDDTLRGQ